MQRHMILYLEVSFLIANMPALLTLPLIEFLNKFLNETYFVFLE